MVKAEPRIPETERPRRSFLAALSAIVAAPAAVVAVPAIAAKVEPAEDLDLLAMGPRIEETFAAYREALAKQAEARAIYQRIKPLLPTELIARDVMDHHMCGGETELDAAVYDASGRRREIYQWRGVKAHIIRQGHSAKTKEGRRLRKIARLARKYETDVAAASKQSGYTQRSDEADAAANELELAIVDLKERAAPSTMAGALILARSISAIDQISAERPHIARDVAFIGRELARTILRIEAARTA